jgi:hypothetical protein
MGSEQYLNYHQCKADVRQYWQLAQAHGAGLLAWLACMEAMYYACKAISHEILILFPHVHVIYTHIYLQVHASQGRNGRLYLILVWTQRLLRFTVAIHILHFLILPKLCNQPFFTVAVTEPPIYTRLGMTVPLNTLTHTYCHSYKPGSPLSTTKGLNKSTSQPRSYMIKGYIIHRNT